MAKKNEKGPKPPKDRPVLIKFPTADYLLHLEEADLDYRNFSDHVRHRLKTHPDHQAFLKRRKPGKSTT